MLGRSRPPSHTGGLAKGPRLLRALAPVSQSPLAPPPASLVGASTLDLVPWPSIPSQSTHCGGT
eukprot:16432088-Heterocapsa_arctica.AAC.1